MSQDPIFQEILKITQENTEVLHFIQENMVMQSEFQEFKKQTEDNFVSYREELKEFKEETSANFSYLKSEISSLQDEIVRARDMLMQSKKTNQEDVSVFLLDLSKLETRVKRVERKVKQITLNRK